MWALSCAVARCAASQGVLSARRGDGTYVQQIHKPAEWLQSAVLHQGKQFFDNVIGQAHGGSRIQGFNDPESST